eukprot:CAMPEP_0174279294 /NCGR_PEP_ID=MMETSP0439-20130205/61952_1 /TAXON_ID=0 /ORGANISM="Stereomyxa ramosa, Strain Chinc5" /LENGTH=358 /DNA_ID=CAMNT_0015371801 /DNA_START=1139 /DNA_END=2215 /DNA_ORIENTATION=+
MAKYLMTKKNLREVEMLCSIFFNPEICKEMIANSTEIEVNKIIQISINVATQQGYLSKPSHADLFFSNLIVACQPSGFCSEAVELFKLHKWRECDVKVMNSVLKVFRNANKTEEGLDFVTNHIMSAYGIVPDPEFHDIVLSGYTKENNVDKVQKYLEDIHQGKKKKLNKNNTLHKTIHRLISTRTSGKKIHNLYKTIQRLNLYLHPLGYVYLLEHFFYLGWSKPALDICSSALALNRLSPSLIHFFFTNYPKTVDRISLVDLRKMARLVVKYGKKLGTSLGTQTGEILLSHILQKGGPQQAFDDYKAFAPDLGSQGLTLIFNHLTNLPSPDPQLLHSVQQELNKWSKQQNDDDYHSSK